MSPMFRYFLVPPIFLGLAVRTAQAFVPNPLPLTSTCDETECILGNVPYLYQYNNDDGEGGAYGGNTCQVTSIAMLVNYFADFSKDKALKPIDSIIPKDLYSQREDAQTPSGAANILKERLGHGWWTMTGTRDQLKGLIRSGRPAVLNGYFTNGGHVVLVVGYNSEGFVFNDPAGVWIQTLGGGYPGGADGSYITYPYNVLDDDIIGANGDMWFASGDTKPVNLGYGNSLD